MQLSILKNKKSLVVLITVVVLVVSGSAAALYISIGSHSRSRSDGQGGVDATSTSGTSKSKSGTVASSANVDSADGAQSNAATSKSSSSKSGSLSNTKNSSELSGNTTAGPSEDGSATCPVATLHMPDGPDGSGGCWPGPLTTGPVVTPTQIYPPFTSGDRYVFDGGEVVDGYIVNGSILVRGNNVVIKNSIVNGAIEVYDTGSLIVMDSEVHGGDWIGYTLTGANYTVLRSDTDGAGAVSICDGNCSFVDTYSHDPHYFDDWDAHQSAYATVGNNKGPLELRHSTVWCNNPVSPPGGGCTGDIALQNTFYPVVDTTIDNNLFMPSASGSYCGTFGWNDSSNIVVTNNVFRRGSNGKCGVFGTADAFRTNGPGNVWSGNTYEDGSVALPNV